jgi:hypothetical protein
LPVHCAGVELARADQLSYSLERQRPEGYPANHTARRQDCQQAAQGVLGAKLVVSERENEEQLNLAKPASKILDDVQGGFIGPMQIL